MEQGDTHLRTSINRHSPSKIIDRDDKRWPSSITKLGKWQNKGKHILILPPSEAIQDLLNAHTWLDDILAKLNKVTSRPIVIRHKPAIGKIGPNLNEQLRDSYAVITYNSKICIDALLNGIPIYCDENGPANGVSFKLKDIETNLMEPDRERFVRHLSYCQFSMKEFKNGTAWSILR